MAALFWLNGAALASVAARFPEIVARLGVTKSLFGVLCAVGPVGGLVSGLFVAGVMRRSSSARVATWAQLVQVVVAGLLLNAPTPALFAVLIFAMSFTDAFTDIAMNAHGLRVQAEYGRNVNNTFHAFWSVGAFCGGLVGAACAGLQISTLWQSVGFGLVMVALNLLARRHLLPGPDHDADATAEAPSRIPRRFLRPLVVLGLIAALSCLIEDAGFTWSALYLDSLGASATVAGLGVSAVVGAQMIGRFTGDRLVDALGTRRVAQIGCGAATVATALALAFPSIPATLVALAVAGFGIATVVPAVFAAADAIPGLRHGSGLGLVNWLLRTSFFVGPPIVGVVADHTSLRVALLIMPVATATVVALAGALQPRAGVVGGNHSCP